MKAIELFRFVVLPVLAVGLVIAFTYQIHENLQEHELNQVARIAEAESWASRSRLIRNVDIMLTALRDVRAYWEEYGHLPREQWASDAGIELDHFSGVEFILWSESSRSLRFARLASNPVLDYRPSDEEWGEYSGLLEKSRGLDRDAMLGPYFDEQNRPYFEIYFLPTEPRGKGTLIARVRSDAALRHLLADSSPGFAIIVTWRGEKIFARGEAANHLPETWVRSGKIRNALGAVWDVTHRPMEELLESLRTPAISMVRKTGLLIALLIGLLLVENGRAERKASTALAAEREVSELNRDLEAQVRERTREVAQRSRDLVTIADSVSHDLRNPINSTSANLQLLEHLHGEQLGEDGGAILQQSSDSLHSMTEILDRLLSLSTVVSERFERQAIDMKVMAGEIFEDTRNLEPEVPTEFVLGEVPDAHAEPIMVRTLLMNLFSNALKYSRHRAQRRIEFSAEPDGAEVVYAVRDNGQGFDAHGAGHLFHAFEKIDGHSDGLGLGLNIAARVVHRHGGRIWAEGQPDEGATFYFTLGPEGRVPE